MPGTLLEGEQRALGDRDSIGALRQGQVHPVNLIYTGPVLSGVFF